jgi:periplasmic divalent cation tolerance protein
MQAPRDYCCVFVTAPNVSVARKLAAAALKDRLVACANLLPKVESHYWWQGGLESSTEVLILFKTTAEKLAELEQCIIKLHPYDTPEFIAIDVKQGNAKYLDWISNSVKKPE